MVVAEEDGQLEVAGGGGAAHDAIAGGAVVIVEGTVVVVGEVDGPVGVFPALAGEGQGGGDAPALAQFVFIANAKLIGADGAGAAVEGGQAAAGLDLEVLGPGGLRGEDGSQSGHAEDCTAAQGGEENRFFHLGMGVRGQCAWGGEGVGVSA